MTDRTALEIVTRLRESRKAIDECLKRGISDETLWFVSGRVEKALVSLHLAEDTIDENLPEGPPKSR